MSVETQPRHFDLDQRLVDQEFNRILARHALLEPTVPLPFTPRSNRIPQPRSPLDDLPPTPLNPQNTARKPGRHRAPRASFVEWLGGRAARATTITLLAAGIALQGAGNMVESFTEHQTAYNTSLGDPAFVIPESTKPIDTPSLPTKHKPLPKTTSLQPSAALTPDTSPAKPAVSTTKKPAIAPADHWPAPGTNCNYLPKHQHKASTTSATQAKAIFRKMVVACFGSKEWSAAEQLWKHESNFQPMARNPNGGACGVVQSLPCSKLLKASGAKKLGDTTVEKQARWGVRYVKSAYGTPTKAWKHWQASVNINGREVGHWY